MSDTSDPIIYTKLLERHGQIRIPMLQRDYAQGRLGEEEVRDRFLDALQDALELPEDDPTLPRNLDFIYGSVEEENGETSFFPLDGQQRLTTLFLLHWYLAWRDDRWDDFQGLFRRDDGHARFSYSVRTTSSEFFDKLVSNHPSETPEEIPSLYEWITDQPWYFRYWRFDPTILSALNMLQALHERFSGKSGLYARLTDEDHPAITFQLLDFKHFGLSDDLYIKMNARGKPLTEFETFKARYEQLLGKQFPGELRKIGDQEFAIAEFVARRMDTAWADFFWAMRQDDSPIFDEAVMNIFRVVALVSRDPKSPSFLRDALNLRDSNNLPSYSVFNARKWLDEDFTRLLICLLEAWSETEGFSNPLLPDTQYFNEKAVFLKLAEDPASLTAPEVIQFSGYSLFIQAYGNGINPAEFQEWMRVVHNLSINSDIDRNDRLQAPLKSLRELIPNATTILQHLSGFGQKDRILGFSERQVREEVVKAGLILADPEWRSLLERAEKHGYFKGQIMFLCEFCGAVAEWESSGTFEWDLVKHADLRRRFKDYLSKAETMFGAGALKPIGESRWQRALLTFGDYLLEKGPNWSLLVNAPTDMASWKRLLGGAGSGYATKRKHLQALWDAIVNDDSYAEQLDQIIANSTGLEPWIEALVRNPKVIEYCWSNMIRWNSNTEVYLLRKVRMSADHAELFTYALYHEVFQQMQKDGRLNPLKLYQYESVSGIDEVPYIPLVFAWRKQNFRFRISFRNGEYSIACYQKSWDDFEDLRALLCYQGGFAGTLLITRKSSPESIKDTLVYLATLAATLPQNTP